MMKRLLLLIHFICLSNYSLGQLNLEDIFPIKLGCSKFEAMEELGKLSYIEQNFPFANMPLLEEDGWYKYDYLNGDSVYRSVLHFDDKRGLLGEPNLTPSWGLEFVDNRLFKIKYSIIYSGSNEKWHFDYATILGIMKASFKYSSDFTITREDTKEQMGEGYYFYDKNENNLSPDKPNYYEIEKTFNFIGNGRIRHYFIRVFHVNCEGTRLTNENY